MKRGQYNFMIKSFEGVIVINAAVGEVQALNSIKNPYLEQITGPQSSSTDIVHYNTYWSNTPKILDYRPTGNGYVAVISPSSNSALSPGKSIMRRSDVTYQFDMMNTGPLPKDIAGTFAGGRYSEGIVTSADEIFYRGGEAISPEGSFFTFEPAESIAGVRIDSAVKPQWLDKNGVLTGVSNVDSLIEARFPVGTKYYYGPSGSQGGVYVGGNTQIFIPNARRIGYFKVIKKLK